MYPWNKCPGGTCPGGGGGLSCHHFDSMNDAIFQLEKYRGKLLQIFNKDIKT